MKDCIIAIDGNLSITSKNTSNNYGSALTWSQNLKLPINFRSEPVEGTAHLMWRADNREQPKGMNIYGGFVDDYRDRLMNILNADKIVALKYSAAYLGEAIDRRKDIPQYIKDKAYTIDWDAIPTIKDTDLDFTKIAVGNSHTPSFADHDSIVVKTDGTTLFSQTSTDFEYVRGCIAAMSNKPTLVTMTFVDIDVRFHILRLSADWKAMIDTWLAFAYELSDTYGCKVELVHPLPIETEDRKHPKTGAYPKNSGIYYYGAESERSALVTEIKNYMNYRMDQVGDTNVTGVSVPEDWYKMDPSLYEREFMERPRSVHLAPKNYRRQGWGPSWTN